MTPRSRLLRFGLLGNAAFSTLCAAILMMTSGPLSVHLGNRPGILIALGVGLLIFAGTLIIQARRTTLDLLQALLTSVGDFLWVVGSGVLLLLAGASFTSLGVALIVGVAVVVGIAGTVQLAGLSRLIAEPDPARKTRNRFALTVRVDASKAAMWEVVSDLGSIAEHYPELASSGLRGTLPAGPGAVRQCATTDGRVWAERCTAWNPGSDLELEFLTDEEGFPYPMSRMLGGWSIQEIDAEHSAVTVWWSFTPKPAWAGLLMVPTMAAGINKSFPPVIHSMARAAKQQARERSSAIR